MKLTRSHLVIGALFFGAIFLRVYQFGSVPTTLNRDEAALGYNAFSIGVAGMDEWGEKYPLIFKSFGDYKLPGYIYVDSLFITVFGVSDLIIRLPSLLAGLGIIILTYLLGLKLVKHRSSAAILSLLVAYQPWTMFYSRMAYEAHVGLFFTLLSLYWFTATKSPFRLAGLVSMLLAILTYNSPWILIPVLALATWTVPGIGRRTKSVLTAGLLCLGIIGLVILLPITRQKQNITIFNDPTVSAYQREAYHNSRSLPAKIWNHRFTYLFRLMGTHTIQSFSPYFLAIRGGHNPWHNAPHTGHIYWMTYGLFVWGLLVLIRKYKTNPWSRFLLILLFGSLLPAISTVDAPHATRSLLFLFCFSLIAGYGLSTLNSKWVKALALAIMIIETLMWTERYFIRFPQDMSTAWPVGIKAALDKASPLYGATTLAITDATNQDLTYEQLYIFPLLYYRVDPRRYQDSRQELPPDSAGLVRIGGFEGISISGYNSSSAWPSARVIRNLQGIYEFTP